MDVGELQAARNKLVEDCAYASDGEVGRLVLFAVVALMDKLAADLDRRSEPREKISMDLRIDTPEDVDLLLDAYHRDEELPTYADRAPELFPAADEKLRPPLEIEQRTGIKASRMYWAIRKGELAHSRVGKRIWLAESDVRRYFEPELAS